MSKKRTPYLEYPKASLLMCILLVSATYIAVVCLLPTDVFWITDNGNRFIQIQSIIKQQFHAIEILPTVALQEFTPLQPPHFYRIGDKIFSYYPFFFSFLSAPMYSLFGNGGLFVIPVLSSIAMLIVFAALCKRISVTDKCSLPVFILGLCTPIFFYTLTLWEHTLTSLLGVVSIFLLVEGKRPSGRRHLLLSGLIAGMIPWFRPEGYVFCSMVVVALVIASKPARVTTAFMCGCLPAIAMLWVFNYRVYGSLFGMHATKYFLLGDLFGTSEAGFGGLLRGKLEVVYTYLLQYSDSMPRGILFSSPFVIALCAGALGRRLDRASHILILCATLAGSVALMIGSFLAPDPVFNTLYTQGMCVCTPFCVFFLLGLRGNLTDGTVWNRFLAVLVLGFIMMTCLIITNYERGILWGSRYFLLVYPFLTIIVVNTYNRMKSSFGSHGLRLLVRCLFFLLMTTSLAIQFYGVGLLFQKTQNTRKIREVLASSTAGYVVTDVFWLPEEMASIFYRKKFMLIQPDARLDVLKAALEAEHVRTFDLVVSPRYSDRGLFNRMRSLFVIKDIRELSDARMRWMDLSVASCDLE